MSKALSLKYRPRTLKTVIGQPEAVAILSQKIARQSIPHVMALTGPSGCGKTTIARILAKALGCAKGDFVEYNSANFTGVATARILIRAANRRPLYGPCRVWVIDEAHQLSKDAQDALLKLFEDTPEYGYFFICTTEPRKLLKAIQTRVFHIPVKLVSANDLTSRLLYITGKENVEVSEDVLEKIVEHAEGSVRMAERLLEKVIDLDSVPQQLKAIDHFSDTKREAVEVARLLMGFRPKWSQVAKVLREMDEEQPETIRRVIIAYFRSVLLGGGKMSARANAIIRIFQHPAISMNCTPGAIASAAYDACNLK